MGNYKDTFSQKGQFSQMRLFCLIYLTGYFVPFRNILFFYNFFHIMEKCLV